MKWSEITPDGWRLPGERAKKGKGTIVPLSSLAREILSDVPQVGEYVFRHHWDAPPRGWSRAIAKVRELSGPMEEWRIHDLRRTFATQLRAIGIERLVVSKLLNHAEGGGPPRFMTATPPTPRRRPQWSVGLTACGRSSAAPRRIMWSRCGLVLDLFSKI